MSRRFRLLLIELLVPFALLGVAEAGARWYLHRSAVPILPRFFPFPITTGKYLSYDALAMRSEPVDVLLMGMSQMLRANARRLSEQTSAELHRTVRVFNFAAPLQTVDFNQRLLNDILLQMDPPRLIVFGVTPINLLHDEHPVETESNVRVSPIFMAYDGTVSGRVYREILEHVMLIRYRDVLRDHLVWTAAAPSDEWMQMARDTDALGDIPFVAPDLPVTRLTAWEPAYKKKFEGFDTLMETSLLFDHLGALARYCRERGIGFVLVNNAVHPLFLTLLPHGRRDYDRFVFRLRNVASDARVPFCDPADGGVGPPELFQDTHHHNVPGSVWLTEKLAACLMESGLLAAPHP